MAGVTNRGKKLILEYFTGRTARPTNFYLAMLTAASAPTADSNVISDHTQIATGNGYTDGGYQLTPGSTDFDASSESDAADTALIQLKDISWTASGGNVPASGGGARYAVMTTDEATVANRQVICWWDLVADRTISTGQTLTLQNLEIDLTE
jgi:hypothetical protein